jgi:hypothetical protein
MTLARTVISAAAAVSVAIALTGCANLPFFGSASGCPSQLIEGTRASSGSLEKFELTEISAKEFQPAIVGSRFTSGCFLVMSYELGGISAVVHTAYVPGGETELAALDTVLTTAGYTGSGIYYTGPDGTTLSAYPNDDNSFPPEQVKRMGLDSIGDEFLIITSVRQQ